MNYKFTVISFIYSFMSYFILSGSLYVKNDSFNIYGSKPMLKQHGIALLILSEANKFNLIFLFSSISIVSLTSGSTSSSKPTKHSKSNSSSTYSNKFSRTISSTTTLL